MIVFEPWARELLFGHLLAALAAIGAAVHLTVRWVARLRGRPRPRLERLHSRVLLVALSLCWLLGAAIYPTFRVRVRGAYFDQELPLATGLFELKEHAGSLALVLAIGLFVLLRQLQTPSDVARHRPLASLLLALLLALLVYSGWTGWYLTCLRAV